MKAALRLPLLSLQHISVSVGGRAILHELDLEIQAGQNILISGAVGAGKSTLLKVIVAEQWPMRGRGTRTYSFTPGNTIASPLIARMHCRRFAPEMQERFARLNFALRAYDVIASGYDDVDYPPASARIPVDARIREFAVLLGIAAVLERPARELSHGMLRRVFIARAAISRPAILALDEALDGLDAEANALAQAFFAHLSAQGTTIVTVSHAPPLIPPLLRTKEYRLENGALETLELALAESATSLAQGDDLLQEAERAGARSAHEIFAALAPKPEAAPLITFDKARIAAFGLELIPQLDWTIREGESWWLQGANGSGKSTLLEMIAGLQLIGGGGLRYLGLERRFSVRELQQFISLCSDRWQARYDWGIAVRDVIASGFTGSIGYFTRGTAEQEQRVHDLIAEFDLHALGTRSMRDLSFGQRRIVLFARALVHDPKVLLLDEFFDGLDSQHAQQLVDAVRRRAARGMSMVITSHQPLVRGVPCTDLIRLAERRAHIRHLFI